MWFKIKSRPLSPWNCFDFFFSFDFRFYQYDTAQIAVRMIGHGVSASVRASLRAYVCVCVSRVCSTVFSLWRHQRNRINSVAGRLAQLVERTLSMREVEGSKPSLSTTIFNLIFLFLLQCYLVYFGYRVLQGRVGNILWFLLHHRSRSSLRKSFPSRFSIRIKRKCNPQHDREAVICR